MSSESVTGERTSKHDVVFWFLFLSGTILMFSYEYLWSRFALRNLATTSFGGWFWTSLAITTPWTFCLIFARELREAVKNGQLKGRATGGPYGGVVVTSASKDIVRFINRPESNAFFTYLGEFQKVKK